MPIETTCPHCRATYLLADHLRGRTVRCKNCQGAIVVGGGSRSQGKSNAAAGKGRGSRRRRPIVGLIPLLILGPVLLIGLLLAPFVRAAAKGVAILGLVVWLAAFVMAYRLFKKKGLKEEMDATAHEYDPGAALIFMQIKYAFDHPRLFACWVALEVLGMIALIAGGVLTSTLHKGGDNPAPPALPAPHPGVIQDRAKK